MAKAAWYSVGIGLLAVVGRVATIWVAWKDILMQGRALEEQFRAWLALEGSAAARLEMASLSNQLWPSSYGRAA